MWRLAQITWDQIDSRKTYPRQWAKDIGITTELVHKLVHIWEVYGIIDPDDWPKFEQVLAEADSKWTRQGAVSHDGTIIKGIIS